MTDPVWGREEMVQVDGRPLRVVRKGSGRPLMLINGIGAAAEMWAPFVARLEGHELIAFDLPGTGKSPPARLPMRMRGLAHLVTRLLDTLGHDSIDVLGYSFGGIVAQQLALRSPQRVSRLVLCATSPGVISLPPRPLAGLLILTPARYYNKSLARRVVPLIAGGRTKRDPFALEDNLVRRLTRPPTTIGYLHQLYSVTGWTNLLWRRRLRQQTLILHGDEDPLVPLANARWMAAAIPHARLLVVTGGGHLFLLDEPASVTAALTNFLSETRTRTDTMLYRAYEARRALSAPLLAVAGAQSAALRQLPGPLAGTRPVRLMRAVTDTLTALEITHRRPGYAIDSATVDGENVIVREETVTSTPFGSLLRFVKEGAPAQPRVLIVPGLAGHFGTLVRGTVRTMLPDHDVYVADWHNVRDVPVDAGRFGLDEYINHIVDFLAEMGPRSHLMAVCQPCVPAIAAAAIMEQDDHPAKPQSLILLAGPVDARVNPGPVNEFAGRASPRMLDRTAIQKVPWPHRGAGRRVYPGFLQVTGFISMDPRRHASAFKGLLQDIVKGNEAAAERTKDFYEEYFAVLDIAAEFYMDTLKTVFTEHHLARGCMDVEGRRVDPSLISSALLTIEGEKDEMCPPGQTHAAHDLCVGIPAERKQHHLQAGVGHYGVFNGSRFDAETYPVIRSFIAESA